MKQLLYIPNSTYVSFFIEGDRFGCLEDYCKKWKKSSEDVIEHIVRNTYNESFYQRNEIVNPTHSTSFEVVEKEE